MSKDKPTTRMPDRFEGDGGPRGEHERRRRHWGEEERRRRKERRHPGSSERDETLDPLLPRTLLP